jgi:hypothetical protein
MYEYFMRELWFVPVSPLLPQLTSDHNKKELLRYQAWWLQLLNGQAEAKLPGGSLNAAHLGDSEVEQ